MAKTPADKWKQTVVKYRKQCQSVLKISKNIRYAGVINKYGRTLAGIISPSVKPLLSQENAKNEFFIMHMLLSMRGYSSKSMGDLDHVILRHRRVQIIALYKDSVIYYISVNKKEKDLEQIISKVAEII